MPLAPATTGEHNPIITATIQAMALVERILFLLRHLSRFDSIKIISLKRQDQGSHLPCFPLLNRERVVSIRCHII